MWNAPNAALDPAERRKVEERAAEFISEEMTLRELRKARHLTQVSVAGAVDRYSSAPMSTIFPHFYAAANSEENSTTTILGNATFLLPEMQLYCSFQPDRASG